MSQITCHRLVTPVLTLSKLKDLVPSPSIRLPLHPYSKLLVAQIPEIAVHIGNMSCVSGNLLVSGDVQASAETIINLRGIDRLCRTVTICALPDDVLLEIFSFHVDRPLWSREDPLDAWHTLVHVCRQWRHVVFASPRGLNLRLRCTNERSVQTMLGVWPALPIVVEGRYGMSRPQVERNIMTALKQRDRVCKIDLSPAPISLLRRLRAIKEPFPVLTDLGLFPTRSAKAPVLPDSFLGGSAPRLRSLHLDGIPFPGLPKLLLSTTELVDLELVDIPNLGYISPEAMATSLASLTRLQRLCLGFHPQSYVVANRLPHLLTRIVLPALTSLFFIGDNEYLEDILSRLDAPLLHYINIEPFRKEVFDTRQLRHLISRTENFKEPHRAIVEFFGSHMSLILFSRGVTTDHHSLVLKTSQISWYWPLSSFAQFCSSALPPLPTLERLEIRKYWQSPFGNTGEWLELLHPFTSVKNLSLPNRAAGCLAPALQGLTVDTVTGTLPALETLLLQGSARSGPTQEAIAQFVATRQLSGRPVAVLYYD